MEPDDNVCYCFGVSMRKLINFSRRVRPSRPSRMTECLGAGTGCGWCIPYLITIARDPNPEILGRLTAGQYAALRKTYVKSSKPKNTFENDSIPPVED